MLYTVCLAASFGAFQAPASLSPALSTAGRAATSDIAMFGGGKKAAPKKAAPKKGGKSPANSKTAISAVGRGSSFIDVTGNAYVEVDTFVPKFDEVGVLPPLCRDGDQARPSRHGCLPRRHHDVQRHALA